MPWVVELHLCVVEKAGVVAATGLFVETDGIVQYHLSGTGGDFRDIQPTKLMMHFARAWARERGDYVLHLGGGVGGAADSLMHFKTGFSPLRHVFTTLRVVIDEEEYHRLVVGPPSGPGFTRAIRLLPDVPPDVTMSRAG